VRSFTHTDNSSYFFHHTAYFFYQALEEVLWRQFGEWGELENINVIHRLSICFVRYR
jgi:hypothetical protein